jgi:hypothetical protein
MIDRDTDDLQADAAVREQHDSGTFHRTHDIMSSGGAESWVVVSSCQIVRGKYA